MGWITNQGRDAFKEANGSTVMESLGGRYVYSPDGPLWTVRQKGRGGTIMAGRQAGTNKICARPLSASEGPIVQSLPGDYYRVRRDEGVHKDDIMKASVMGWPMRTASAVISGVIKVLKDCNYLMMGNDGKEDWVNVGGNTEKECIS